MRIETENWTAEKKLVLNTPAFEAFVEAEETAPTPLDVEQVWVARWEAESDFPSVGDLLTLNQEINKADPQPRKIYVSAFPHPGTMIFGMELV